MPEASSSRLDVDETTALSFIDNLESFSSCLSATEQAILSALLHAAMDPWSRSVQDPPASLTAAEASAIDRMTAHATPDPQGD